MRYILANTVLNYDKCIKILLSVFDQLNEYGAQTVQQANNNKLVSASIYCSQQAGLNIVV